MHGTSPDFVAAEEDPVLRDLKSLGFGQILGRYILLRRLAAGGMAEVYVARSNSLAGLGKRVAIKKILPQHSHNERFVEMLVDEAKITVSLAHPNIAQVYELAVDHDYFIVMEYVDGPPLSRLIVRASEHGLQGIPFELAAHIIAETAKGLDHAHKQLDGRGNALNIIHRDVSPQNILISHQGDVKLIDFGIARAVGRAAHTAQGVIKGKLRYLAPEIANAEDPDWRADIYCCGIVLFEALTGLPMFSPTSDVEAISMAAGGCVRSPRAANPNIPEELDRIVMRAVAKERTQRYQSAKELAHDLRVFSNRQYPKFTEAELGDFMQRMFATEIEHERCLDVVSEKYLRVKPRAAASSVISSADEAPTIAPFAHPEIAKVEFPDRPSYKKLVTAVAPARRKLTSRPPAIGAAETFEERDTDPPDETRLRKAHFEVHSDLTDLQQGTGEVFQTEVFHDTAEALTEFPDELLPPRTQPRVHDFDATEVPPAHALHDALRRSLDYPAGEASFSEEFDVGEDTAPSLARRDELRPELITDWRPKAFRGWRSKNGGWSFGQLIAVFVCFSIGGVALAIALEQREEPIVIPAEPTAAEPAADPVIQIPVVSVPLGAAAEEAVDEEPEQEPEEKVASSKLGALKIKSFPAASIVVDGKKRGRTPKTIYLKPGTHRIQLEGPNGETRELNRYVNRGKNPPVSQYW